ncbi:hypothetical protein ALC60_08492 [Trachymyrmex zeteki]|uniref:Uncharacterized protein n=1 Tax=Mycetomoellerius zeteki TaxID=64791 RepID=A0A151WXJ2_9HYME|nr:hypothetical protein ALC60_08492 [Trachymyrmex zeteki]
MTETLERALAPLLIFGSFCDLGMFERPLGQPRPYISCLYILAKWILYTYYCLYTRYIDILQTGDMFVADFIPLITIILIFICLYRHNDFDTLFKNFVLNYPNFVHVLSALIWGTILGYTSSRIHQVNDRLHVFYSDLFENNADYRGQNRSIVVCQRITKAVDHTQYMWILMYFLKRYYTHMRTHVCMYVCMYVYMYVYSVPHFNFHIVISKKYKRFKKMFLKVRGFHIVVTLFFSR